MTKDKRTFTCVQVLKIIEWLIKFAVFDTLFPIFNYYN